MAGVPPECEENPEPLTYQTWVLRVSIHCEGCKRKVKRILHSVEGVYTIDINRKQHKVMVTGNVDSTTLIRKLKKSGKQAELWSDYLNRTIYNNNNNNNNNNNSDNSCYQDQYQQQQQQQQQQQPMQNPEDETQNPSNPQPDNSNPDNGQVNNGQINNGQINNGQVNNGQQVRFQDDPNKPPPENGGAPKKKKKRKGKSSGGGGGGNTSAIPNDNNGINGNNGNNGNVTVNGSCEGVGDQQQPNGGPPPYSEPQQGPPPDYGPNQGPYPGPGPGQGHMGPGPGQGHMGPGPGYGNRVYEYAPAYYEPPPVYAVSYNTAYPSGYNTASYYSAPTPYSYTYVRHGGDVEPPPPSNTFEIFSDENPNACCVM